MTRTSLWILAFALALSGCGLAKIAEREKALAEARQVHQRDLAECERRFPDRYKKPTMPRVQCFNEANLRFAAGGDPDIDLLRAMGARILVSAERYDAGRLTPAQYEAEKAGVFAEYNTQVQQRRNNAVVADAANRQAWAAQAQAIQAAMPRTTTCNRFGNTVTCY
jgi:hypothetical protein